MSVEIAPGSLWAVAFALGLVIGSFLNVVIHRLPAGRSIVYPASQCPSCEAPIRPWDNVPVLSYLWLRGRCRACGTRISLRYPAVELLTAVVFLAVAVRFGVSGWTLAYWIFAAALIAAALIDHDHQIIPDTLSLGGLVLALAAMPPIRAAYGLGYRDALVESVAGAAVGAGLLWIVAFVHARVCVALGREFSHWPGEGESFPKPSEPDYWLWFPGLGLGDVKLLGMVGAVLGPVGVLDTILASSLIGLVLGGISAVGGGALGRPFGFAPAIAIGGVATLFLPPLWLLALF